MSTGAGARAKNKVRAALLARRRTLDPTARTEAAELLAGHLLAAPEVRRALTVAAYVSVGREPGTGPLLSALGEAGVRVLLPVLRPDNDLDWAEHDGSLAAATRGLLEPIGAPLGVEAITEADAVLLPGLAADRRGMRLGRGGGSYDRAMARVSPSVFTCVLLHEGELLDEVPTEPHDRAVSAAAMPTGLVRFSPPV